MNNAGDRDELRFSIRLSGIYPDPEVVELPIWKVT